MELNNAKLLDCTLRDGAYLIDKKFGDETIIGIIDGLNKANIDIIEIGFYRTKVLERVKLFIKTAKTARSTLSQRTTRPCTLFWLITADIQLKIWMIIRENHLTLCVRAFLNPKDMML